LSATAGWTLALVVPAAALPVFEGALGTLGGALVIGVAGERSGAGAVPLRLYLTQQPDRAEAAALLATAAAAAGVAVPAFEVDALPELDWVAESQTALPPIHAGRFYIHGSHATKAAPAASIPILIDAGAAFGTGRHESTRGCLIALSRLARWRRFRRPLDLGCGSGVLAIAIAKLWPVPVLAVDNDRTALRVARDNARVNGVAPRLRHGASDGYRSAEVARRAPYDLIVANILAAPLAAMAGDLARCLAPGGVAVLSGLLAAQQRAVIAPHRSRGLRLKHRVLVGDWATLVLYQRS
jgi:ribosomal protein L11 methyltransferase